MSDDQTRTKGEYFVALFDVLGFESQLARLKLEGMLQKYEELITIVNAKNDEHSRYRKGNFHGAFWLKIEGEDGVHPIVLHEIAGAYASDSIIVWANRRLLGIPARIVTESEGMTFQSPYVYSDPFLDVCSEIMCHAIEIGLPLRGGISTGAAVLERDSNIYLGEPIIDAARIEHKHNFIGVSFHKNYDALAKFEKYSLAYNKDFKDDPKGLLSGNVLDWPRYWRSTRGSDIARAIERIDNADHYSQYYKNTLRFVQYSIDNEKPLLPADVNMVFPNIQASELGLPMRLGKNG